MLLCNIVKYGCRIIIKIFYGAKLYNKENIPKEGGFIICGNHSSNWDPAVIGSLFPGYIQYMAKAELFKFKPFGYMIRKSGAIPIHRGSQDKSALLEIESALKNGGRVVIFPEGHRTKPFRKNGGKNGAARLAKKCNVPILPVGVRGFKAYIGKPFDIETENYNVETERILDRIEELL